jgi:formiminotetrahydrofolate cyclodeaminase
MRAPEPAPDAARLVRSALEQGHPERLSDTGVAARVAAAVGIPDGLRHVGVGDAA